MSAFWKALRSMPFEPADRTWVYVPYDQLNDRIGPLSELDPKKAGIVLIETRWKAARRPYHKQKLALILANQRHFALEQAKRGVAVHYRMAETDYADVLADIIQERGPLLCAEPAERELRDVLTPLFDDGRLIRTPHTGWLTTADQFTAAVGASAPWRMDAFYRHIRRETGVLMNGDSPDGGRFSFDGDNRRPWSGEPAAPSPPTFEPDRITREVGQIVEQQFADHPGTLNLANLPATSDDAAAVWRWALEYALPEFGPYEDAMSKAHRSLFHTQLAPLLNLHRVLASTVVRDAERATLPMNCKEGFIRQILGWREFVRHVHTATDGFRSLKGAPTAETPDAGAAPSVLGATHPLPAAWWDAPSGLACLDTVVAEVWEHGWTHHIPRLMVLSNLATLLDISPRELTDWFWVAFVDAFDWVVEPNVLSMGTFGTGPVMTTKPYVSGANYLNKMGDYCGSCAFHPKKTCPITPLYWAFLARHQEALSTNQRMSLALGGLKRRSPERREQDALTLEVVRGAMDAGERLTPERLKAGLSRPN